MDLDYLRTATRPEHEAVEALMPLMTPELTTALYVSVLHALYPMVLSWESWAAAHAPESLAALLHARRRAPWLQTDLQFFEEPIPRVDIFSAGDVRGLDALDPASFQAALLGAMYVMEGSTLGGQYIARHAEPTLGLSPGVGDAYFRGHGERTGVMWREFKAVLAAVPEGQTETLVQAARDMFAFFGRGLRETLPVVARSRQPA